MIVENSRKKEVMKVLTPIIPKNRNFEVKIANTNESLSYYVIDQNELWISLQKKTESDLAMRVMDKRQKHGNILPRKL